MELAGIKIGVCMTGSFCMFDETFDRILELVELGADVRVIFSDNSQKLDSRFGKTDDFRAKVIELTGKTPITTIQEAETIGPKRLFDIILIAPATGNTIAKLANAITDTPTLMAVKAHMRVNRPVAIFLSTNDALGLNLKNIAELLNSKLIYFVPFGQDNCIEKPKSMVSKPDLIVPTLQKALLGEQIQPLLV